jgi:hypothetical protein
VEVGEDLAVVDVCEFWVLTGALEMVALEE